MNALRRYIDKIKPNVEEGGKLHFLKSTFEGFESFLFVPKDVTTSGSHIRDAFDTKRAMFMVVLATVPALLFGMWNTGYQHYLAMGIDSTFWENFWLGFLRVLPLIVVSYVTGLGIEFIFAQIRGHEIQEGFLVSGILIPLIVPVDVPLWMVALATAFAVIIGKEVFGGTGMNIMNPALTARAFLFFAYPAWMSGDQVWVHGLKKGLETVDGYSGSTILNQAAQGVTNAVDGVGHVYTAWDKFLGVIPGSIGETSTLAILLGGIFLIVIGVGSWKIMFSTFAGGAIMGLILNAFGGNALMDMPFWEHLIVGGFAFGAVFMATDPVTAAQTERGKWIYGFLIGVLAIIIRVFNPGYPEGMMLAILLMNVFAPLIDHYIVEGNIRRRLKRAKVQV